MSRPRFTPEERTPGIHCIGGWVGPRAGLDIEARGKILCPCQRSNLDRPVVQPVARHYTDWATRLTIRVYRRSFTWNVRDLTCSRLTIFPEIRYLNFKRAQWLEKKKMLLSWHSPGGTEGNHKIMCQDSQSAGRDLNLGPPKYLMRCLVTVCSYRYPAMCKYFKNLPFSY
jgi:hypothetical protein